jgi:hypothetical protein
MDSWKRLAELRPLSGVCMALLARGFSVPDMTYWRYAMNKSHISIPAPSLPPWTCAVVDSTERAWVFGPAGPKLIMARSNPDCIKTPDICPSSVPCSSLHLTVGRRPYMSWQSFCDLRCRSGCGGDHGGARPQARSIGRARRGPYESRSRRPAAAAFASAGAVASRRNASRTRARSLRLIGLVM